MPAPAVRPPGTVTFLGILTAVSLIGLLFVAIPWFVGGPDWPGYVGITPWVVVFFFSFLICLVGLLVALSVVSALSSVVESTRRGSAG